MISVVMPYWNRLELLQRSVRRMVELYPNARMELVIADDGSKEAALIDFDCPWPVKIIYLPRKEVALNPCVPLNRAVAATSGHVLVITNPEILHVAPILEDMLAELISLGRTGYVLAATWSTNHRRWYCHSTITSKVNASLGRLPLPEGSGLHFCSMMYKTFFREIGGFDEEYREGQGVEDNDFVLKLKEAGARFSLRDDLVVFHESTPTVVWPSGGIARNTEIYKRKWKHVPEAF